MSHFPPSELRAAVKAHVANFDSLPPNERVLQCMAHLADVLKVKETGNNRGTWVESFQANIGIPAESSWCAACLAFCADAAHALRPPNAVAGSVHGWKQWAKNGGLLVKAPARGVACLHDSGGGHGHIGIVKGTLTGFVQSIEGNTSSGVLGSQDNGDGVYRRTRTKGFWGLGYIQFVEALKS